MPAQDVGHILVTPRGLAFLTSCYLALLLPQIKKKSHIVETSAVKVIKLVSSSLVAGQIKLECLPLASFFLRLL